MDVYFEAEPRGDVDAILAMVSDGISDEAPGAGAGGNPRREGCGPSVRRAVARGPEPSTISTTVCFIDGLVMSGRRERRTPRAVGKLAPGLQNGRDCWDHSPAEPLGRVPQRPHPHSELGIPDCR